MKNSEKGNGWALLPIIVFLVLFIGTGVLHNDFYAMPAIVGFMIALIVAFVQTKQYSFDERMKIIARGVGNENVVTMCLIFLAAGAFSGAVTQAGGASSTVNLALSYLPPSIAVLGLFIIGCFISLSMGTSMGTIATLAPIAMKIASTAGFSLPICMGAVISGAMFGDNLSMISDTTIASVKTQGCKMRDKFKANFKIVLPAAIVTLFLLYTQSKGIMYCLNETLDYNIVQVLPYLFVLIAALCGVNVFIVLISGTVLSIIVGLSTNAMTSGMIYKSIGSGVSSMYEITVISMLVAGISELIKVNGGFDYLLHKITSGITSYKKAELGIVVLIVLIDIATANNTVAIVIAGPIAKQLSDYYGIKAERSASLLDMFASVTQGVIPYGAQVLSAASLTGLTTFEIMPYLYYPYLMGICGLISILFVYKSSEA